MVTADAVQLPCFSGFTGAHSTHSKAAHMDWSDRSSFELAEWPYRAPLLSGKVHQK